MSKTKAKVRPERKQKKKAGKTPRRRAGRGALLLISGLFFASGLLRLGNGTGEAIAKEIESLAKPQVAAPAEAVAACTDPAAVGDLLATLDRRESSVTEREARIADRLQVLAVAEASVQEHLAALVKAEDALKSTMAQASSASEDDLAKLTAVYENMKPKGAAALFEAMDPEFSAGFLGRMRPDAAAAIMTGLSPEKAYTISVVLAGRNANAPTD